MGELSIIFAELVRVLKYLPPGGFDRDYAHKPPTAAASKAVSFMCDKQLLKEEVRLAEMGSNLAEQAHTPGESRPDPLVKKILAAMHSLEAQVDQLLLDTANLATKLYGRYSKSYQQSRKSEGKLALETDAWVVTVNQILGLNQRKSPIIVHGIPTTFNPESHLHLHDSIEGNHGVWDSTTRVVWANKHSIKTGKPCSSLIIHLFDPVAANLAITNRICSKHLLKVAEESKKHIKKCYTCLDYGHFSKNLLRKSPKRAPTAQVDTIMTPAPN